jgi:AsmA protein
LGGNAPAGSGTGGGGASDPLGGNLGATIGNLLQQGIGQSRNIPARQPPSPPSPAASSAPPGPAAPAPSDPAPPPSQDSQPMNDVLRQLFNR